MHMRIATWNLNNRSRNQVAWDVLLSLNPDVALLSEVNFIPDDLSGYAGLFETAMGPDRQPRRFKTGLIVRGEIGDAVPLRARQPWVNEALSVFTGNFVGRTIRLGSGEVLHVISVHMPSWQFPYREFTTGDVSDVMLPNYSKMYMSELLWAALQNSMPHYCRDVIVGGDFNTSEFIGSSKRQHEANREAIRRMCELGFVETVRHLNGGPVPTWRSRQKNAPLKHQLDHLYVSGTLRDRLLRAWVCEQDAIFDKDLSDHLPVIAEFDSPG